MAEQYFFFGRGQGRERACPRGGVAGAAGRRGVAPSAATPPPPARHLAHLPAGCGVSAPVAHAGTAQTEHAHPVENVATNKREKATAGGKKLQRMKRAEKMESTRPVEEMLRRTELFPDKLAILLTNKYHSLEDAKEILGDVANIARLFIESQEHLYKQQAA